MKHFLTIGFLLSLAVNCTATTHSYDTLNRLTKVEYSPTFSIEYTYDDSGNRTSRTVIDSTHTITTPIPNGGGSISGDGPTSIDSLVTLQATPNTGNQFNYWKENGTILDYSNPYTFIATSSRNIEAYFSIIGSFTAYLSTYHLDPDSSGSPSADPDNDSMVNLIEYALGGNPNEYDLHINPVHGYVSLPNGSPAIFFEFYYSVKAESHAYIGVDYSTDFLTWTMAVDGQDGVSITITSIDQETKHLRAVIPWVATNVFARMHVEID